MMQDVNNRGNPGRGRGKGVYESCVPSVQFSENPKLLKKKKQKNPQLYQLKKMYYSQSWKINKSKKKKYHSTPHSYHHITGCLILKVKRIL